MTHDDNIPFGVGVELRVDGKLVFHATTILKRPNNHDELVALLKEIIVAMDAPTVKEGEGLSHLQMMVKQLH